MQRFSQSPDLNPTEMLFHDLKLAVRTGKTSNLNELKYFCKEHWASTVRRPNVERLIGKLLQMADCSSCFQQWHNQLCGVCMCGFSLSTPKQLTVHHPHTCSWTRFCDSSVYSMSLASLAGIIAKSSTCFCSR